MTRQHCSLIALLISSALLAGEEPDATARLVADPPVAEALRNNQTVLAFLKEIPPGYRLKPEVQYGWSEKVQKQILTIVSLTPLDPEGRPDGEARYYSAWYVGRTVPYKHGVKDGIEKEYHYPEGGKAPLVVAETPWKDGKIQGVKKLYHHSNGKLRMEVPYVDGLRHGDAKTYDLPGRLEKLEPFDKDRLHGQVIEYWPATGKPKKVIPFNKGVVNGTVVEYFENGKVKKETPVKNDLFDGIETEYDETGAVIQKRYWLEDRLVTKEEYEKASRKR